MPCRAGRHTTPIDAGCRKPGRIRDFPSLRTARHQPKCLFWRMSRNGLHHSDKIPCRRHRKRRDRKRNDITRTGVPLSSPPANRQRLRPKAN
jgi:hypothetical protein